VQKKKAKTEGVKPSADQALIEKSIDALKFKLKDPESSQFRNVHVTLLPLFHIVLKPLSTNPNNTKPGKITDTRELFFSDIPYCQSSTLRLSLRPYSAA